MPNISTIVSVQIDRQTQAVTAAGFGLPMFLGLHKAFTERLRLYTSIEAVAEDFSLNSAEYKAAQKFFGQEISVEQIAFGRQDSSTATLTPVVANGATYRVTINGTDFTYVSDASALDTEIVADLVSSINAGSEPVTASGTTTLILTPDVPGEAFSLQFSSNFGVAYAASETLTEALTAIASENNDWYGVAAYSHVKADILEIAAYVEAAKKLYITSSSDSDILTATGSDTTSTAKALSDAAYERTALLYSASADTQYPECAWLGGELSKDPGQATWKFKTLTGVTVDNLTPTQSTNVLAKNANTYEAVGGVNITSNGTVASGEFIDVIRDIDWLTARIQERVYQSLVNLPKIPFTDTGIAIIESAVRAQLLQAVSAGVLSNDPAPTVQVPRARDVAPNDKANRLLPDVKFFGTLAGAIHSVQIRGVISL